VARRLTTRGFERRDVSAVFDLERATVEAAHWPRSEYERLAGSSPLALVTEKAGGAIVAFLIARRAADEVEILNLAVCGRLRRKGIASALLSRLFEKLEAAPARIYLEVRRSNKPAIAFYERHGFGCVGERRNYYRHPTEDALVLSLSKTEKI
jgi:ribosomal-protein-alanine acetyltransferase